MRILALLFLSLIIVGCEARHLPSKDELIAEFSRRNVKAIVVDAVVEEGDSQNTYWKIRYRLPKENFTYEIVWGVRGGSATDWDVFHIGHTKVVPK